MWGVIIGAIVGGATGALVGYEVSKEEQEEIEETAKAQKALLEAQTKAKKEAAERDIELATLQFEYETEEALESAADYEEEAKKLDAQTDFQETVASLGYSQAIAQTSDYQTNAAYTEQSAKTSFEKSQGALKSDIGASGTRAGGSRDTVVAQNEEAFAQDVSLAREQVRKSSGYSIAGAASGLNQARLGISVARGNANEAYEDAEQLRDDYRTGGIDVNAQDTSGRAVKLFHKTIETRRENLDSEIDLANLAGKFQQEAYQRAYERAEFTFIDAFTTILSGGAHGMETGKSYSDFYDKWFSDNK